RFWCAPARPAPPWRAAQPLAKQPLKEHGRYMLDLYRRGLLQLAGPFGDDSGGALVFRAPSEREARAIVAADPAVVDGVFRYELRPWKLVAWNELASGSR